VIETEGLCKRFGDKLVIDNLSLRVEAGEVMGFLGPNGSGKTTTIRLLMGLLRPSAGRAAILGRDCHRDAVALKRDVGYLPDEPFLYPYLSGLETLELVGRLHGFDPAEATRRAAALAERLGLGTAAGAYTVTYSLGQKKRLALALSLIHDPKVLILDEPTANLSPKLADSLLREQVLRLAGLGKAVLLVEQRARAVMQIADWTSVLVSGSVRLEGRPADLLKRQDFEELFLGAATELAASDESNLEET
jgi:ABC-type multidrug transport system ATPase subunit